MSGIVDLNPQSGAEKKTFMSLPDTDLLRRFTGNDLPYNSAPPTETSLRDSMAKE
ncbi:hypothetical protein HDZ31DRAFT_64694 [Schizophyllum fasciatum]